MLSVKINKRTRAGPDGDPPHRTHPISARLESPWPPFSQCSWRVSLHCLHTETLPSHSVSWGLAGKHCGCWVPACPTVLPSLFKSGHSSPASLFLATLSWVQMPTAEATEDCDRKSRRGGRWKGGQQSCLVSRSDIPDTFCLEK